MPELTDTQLEDLIKAIGLKKPQVGSPRKPIAHGTYKGAHQHRYREEPLCQPCRDAENEYQRQRFARKPKQYLTEEEWQARQAARQNGGAA